MSDINDQSTGVPWKAALWLSAVLLLGASTGSHASETNSPTVVADAQRGFVPSFHVERYEIVGSSAVSQETVAQVMSEAIGEVNVAKIRHALLKLQKVYRDNGYSKAAITLPKQPLTNGVVYVRVSEGAEPLSTELPDWSVSNYEVRHFEIRGNTVLKPEEIDLILSPAVTVDQLLPVLKALQLAYRARGLAEASVTVPQQLLTDGTVIVQIVEGPSALAGDIAKNQQTNTVATVRPPARVFDVRHYEVLGNTLLRPETIDTILNPATGTNITFAQIQKALGELQLAYRERGFASANVSLPQQQLTNATVKVQITEGRLVDVRVTGNHHFSSNNVMRALPSLQRALDKKEVVNSRVLQREVDLANQNRDRQIFPVINPGPEPGTSALDLKIKDRLPLHARMELNNQSTPGTPDWRINTSANYNNLWDREQSVGLFYGFTPEKFKSGGLVDDYILNRPLIANYGAYYRIPFGNPESVQEIINNSAKFGYDEATHQFRLPPAGSRPDVTFSMSGSLSDTGEILAPLTQVASTPLLTIASQDSGQEITINQGAGTAFNVPFAASEAHRFNFSAGVDVKHDERDSYNANNFIITTTVTNSQGSQTIESRLRSPQPTVHDELTYVPLNLGLDFSETDPRGTFFAHLSLSGNFVGENTDFVRFSQPGAQSGFAKTSLTLTRDQTVFKTGSLLLRGSAQAASGSLISDEQFTLGGVNSVRGYFEGDERGDNGWFGSAELRTPYINARVPAWSESVPAWVRGSVFVDGAQRFLLDDAAGQSRSRFLLGAGFGLSANINNAVDMRISVGWPFEDTANSSAGQPHAYFSLGGQF